MSEASTQDTSLPTPQEQSNAATPGPQPSPIATAIAGSPNASTGTAATPASAPTPIAQPTARDAVEAHHSMLGRVASALLGKQMEYRVNPQTGQTEAYEVPEKPGQLFRHILAGALLGGAAAHQGQVSVDPVTGQRTRMASGPLAGFLAGGVASMEATKAGEQQRYDQAQQQFKNEQTARTASREEARIQDEKVKTAAQTEYWNKEVLLHERDSNLRDSEFHENHNARMEAIRDKATEQGAVDAPIPGNGEQGNGKRFAKLFTDDPSQFRPPEGYNRIVTTDTDMTGVQWDRGKGYVDANGNAVDLKDKTTWHVQYLPTNAAKEPLEMKGADLNKLFPKTAGTLLKPDKIYRVPFEQVLGLALKEHETNRREANEAWHYKHDEITTQLGELKNKADNFTKEAIAAERNAEFNPQAAADAKEFRQKAQDAYDEYDRVQAQAHPQSRERKLDSGRNNPAKPANSQPLKVGDIGDVNGKRMKVTKLDASGKPIAGIPVDANGQPLTQ